MGWVRIDDAFYDHPGHAGLELAAWGLWAWSLAWSNRNLTDGKIPAGVVKRMDPDGDASGALIAAGRWHGTEEGVEIHDYLEFQPSAEQVRKKRDKERERWHRRGSEAPPQDPDQDSAATPPRSDRGGGETPRVSQPQDTRAFDRWWNGWPRKVDKARARNEFAARLRQGVTSEALTAARDEYLSRADPAFVKHAATFLHGADGPWSEYLEPPPEDPGDPFDIDPPAPNGKRCEACAESNGFIDTVLDTVGPDGRREVSRKVCDHGKVKT